MNVNIKDGSIIIKLPYSEKGKESKSGKSLVHATTNGNKEYTVDGKTLKIGINVFSMIENTEE